jgi:acyl-CoA thioesterase I
MPTIIQKDSVVLFQGDSITNAGRDHSNGADLGRGFVSLTAAWFSMLHPHLNVRFINRGVGSNTVKNLEARWHEDCLDLGPTWVSIMVGINDAARRFAFNEPMPPEEFESIYRHILTQAQDQLDARFILVEPFVLPTDSDRMLWRTDLDPKIQVVRSLAREFRAVLVPFDGILSEAATKREMAYWAPDGVHLTPAGQALLAQSWLRAVKAI